MNEPLPKILIVDDRAANLMALRKLLESLEAEILEASSGTEALGMMLENELVLMLLDVDMPGMDGFEVARLAQGVERTRSVPILFLTAAFQDDVHRLRGYRSGAMDYIEKPVQDEILLAKVRIFLDLFLTRKALETTNDQLRKEIARREKLEKKLQEMNQNLEHLVAARTRDLERSNQDLQQFAHAASHDLQEPLRLVSGYVQLLEKRYRGALDEKADKYINYVTDSVQHMQALIDSLLIYSRIGTRGMAFTESDCNVVMDQAITHLQKIIQQSGARITRTPLPTVPVDETQWLQLFQNLLSNAIKFRESDNPTIHVSAKNKDREWIFSIQDNGIGIEPKFSERVFIIFQKLHPRSRFQGTGIGLALCKRIVERHGGRIWIEPAPERGSIVHFSIPATRSGYES